MAIDIDLDCLGYQSLKQLAEVIERRTMGRVTNAAALSALSRASSGKAFPLDVLECLMRIAADSQISFDRLLRIRDGDIFDTQTLDSARTLMYLGVPEFSSTIKVGLYSELASVYDLWAARKLAARANTRDLRSLRWAPAWEGDASELLAAVRSACGVDPSEAGREDSREEGPPIICVGSPKLNAMSEYIMARALGARAFEPESWAGPVRFLSTDHPVGMVNRRSEDRRMPRVFVEFDREEKRALEWVRVSDGTEERRVLKYCEPVGLASDGAAKGHSNVWLDEDTNEPIDHLSGHRHAARVCAAFGQTEYSQGRDHAIVLVHRHAADAIRLLVAGCSAVGTYGAAALLAEFEGLFSVPDAKGATQVFLVEVAFVMRGGMRYATAARILDRCDRFGGRSVFEAPRGDRAGWQPLVLDRAEIRPTLT